MAAIWRDGHPSCRLVHEYTASLPDGGVEYPHLARLAEHTAGHEGVSPVRGKCRVEAGTARDDRVAVDRRFGVGVDHDDFT